MQESQSSLPPQAAHAVALVESTRRAARDAALKRLKITTQRILEEYSLIAFSKINDYVDVAEGGELQFKPFASIPSKKLRAIRKIKETTKITETDDGTRIFKESKVEIDLWDKLKALDALSEACEVMPEKKTTITGPNGGPIRMTMFPPEPKSIEEWLEMCKKAEDSGEEG